MSDHLFVTFRGGEFELWDFRSQRRFVVDATVLERLKEWSRGAKESLTGLDLDLLAKDLLARADPRSSQADAWGWDLLSYMFHVGTHYTVEAEEARQLEGFSEKLRHTVQRLETEGLDFYSRRDGDALDLPVAEVEGLNASGFGDVLRRRKTCRQYYGDPIDQATLNTLLYTTFGRVHASGSDSSNTWTEPGAAERHIGYRRTSPSGGSLQVIEAYVVVSHVTGVPAGIYHYDSLKHDLVLVREGATSEEITRLLVGQPFGEGAAVGVFLVARFDRAWWRYKVSRGYRVALLDAGHVSQTFQLVATALGLNTWLTAAFVDRAVEEFLGLNVPKEAALMYVCAGRGSGSAFQAGS